MSIDVVREKEMSDNRKRKHGTVEGPSDDFVNEIIKRHSESFQESSFQGSSDDVENKNSNVELVGITDCCNDHPLLADFRVLNDPVHGHVKMPSILFTIIDTPQFQRLREIKQLGSCYLVFPGACHNRFEHSIGVAHLAGCMCRTLQKGQPELNITQKDCLCVQIAGLCHDLGHGPLSHFFDGLFIPRVHPESTWCHEDASVQMFDHMVEENNLLPIFKSIGLDERDIIFIKELIGGLNKTFYNADQWQYIGRPKSKCYLYEIVANKRTGIDVDKWDYFARDCYYLGIANNFDYKRFMKFARVLSVDGNFQICTRDKEVNTLYDMFHTRITLHRRAYQHKTAKIIETMLCDALVYANEHIKLPGANGKSYSISDSINDMKAYTNLTDAVFQLIELSNDETLQQAKNILHRVKTRDLYKLIGQTVLCVTVDKRQSDKLCADIMSENTCLDTNDFAVQIIEFDYGMKDKNPIDQVRFYDKKIPAKAVRLKKNQVSQMLPETFTEQHLRFYYKSNDHNVIEEAKRIFQRWCNKMLSPTNFKDSPELSSCS